MVCKNKDIRDCLGKRDTSGYTTTSNDITDPDIHVMSPIPGDYL